MTLDDKLELFYQTAIEDAVAQSKVIIQEYESSLDEEYERKRASVLREANNAYQIEKEEILHKKYKMVSKATRDVKRQLLEEEKSYIEILFSLVEKRLHEYMKTDEYEKKLEKQILQAKELADGASIQIYINASDKDKKDMLESKTGVPLSISTIEFIGGMRAVIRSSNILIDNSFLTKLTEEKEAYKM